MIEVSVKKELIKCTYYKAKRLKPADLVPTE